MVGSMLDGSLSTKGWCGNLLLQEGIKGLDTD